MTPRLQCILLRTLPYNFTVRYISGPKNLLADCLSRLGNQKDTIKLPKLHVYQISHQLPARSDSLQEIWQATQADDKLALLKHTIMMGWPNNINEIPQVLHPYWTFCKELTIKDGLILKGTQIVIPNRKCEAILKQIHDSHLGLTKYKLCAKQAVYWPGVNDQLEQLVLNCQLCLKYLRSKKKPDTYSALGQEVPIFPWTKVATDLFYFEGNSYLLLVDYTSWFPVVRKLMSMTAHHITDHIKQIFAEYGRPDTLVSDNGPCYTNETTKEPIFQIYLLLSNAAKWQMGLHSEDPRVNQKNQHLPTHDLCLDQTVMYQDATNMKWYPAKITKLCDKPRSYIISTENGTQYRKTQKHLKSYQLRSQINVKDLPTQCNNNYMQLRSRNSLKLPNRFQAI